VLFAGAYFLYIHSKVFPVLYLFDKSLLLVISFFSLDEVSAKCEDLGLFGRIMMVKPFEEAAFNSKERINSQKTILTRKIR
jgi:hypothetical protein